MADQQTQTAIDQAQDQQKIFRLAERVTRRHLMLEADTERHDWIDRCKDVIRFVRPDLIAWMWDNQCRGEKAGQYMHTSKPFTDAINASNGWTGNVFGDSDWVVPSMPDVEELLPEQMKDELQKWHQQCAKWLTTQYRHGTFMMIQPALALDAHTIGEGLSYKGEEKGRIYDKKCNILDAYLKRGHDLKLRIVHYLEHYMAGEAWEIWGDKLSPTACSAAISEPTRRVTIIRCVYTVDDKIFADIEGLDNRDIIPEQPITHYEVLIEKDSIKNQSAYDSKDPLCGILEHHAYRENPFADWPYFLNNQESYGWSPYAAAIISIKRLHAQYKGISNAAQQATDAAMKTTAGLKNRIDLRPGHISYLDNPNDILEEAYRRPVIWPFAIEFLQRHENELEEVLHLSLYQAMTMRTKEMTVPEVLEVIGEKARMLSPVIGTYQHLYANPNHDRMYALARKLKIGPIPRPPAWLEDVIRDNKLDGQILMLYRGPLAMAAEQVLTQRTLLTNFQLLGTLASFGEKAAVEVQDQIKFGTLAEYVMDHMDMPQDVIAKEAEVQEAQKTRVLTAQAQVAAEVAKTASEAERNQAQGEAVRTQTAKGAA